MDNPADQARAMTFAMFEAVEAGDLDAAMKLAGIKKPELTKETDDDR